MKKNLLRVLVFSFVTLILLYALQLGIDYRYYKNSSSKYSKLMRHELDPDIMLFGPSTVIKHYSPTIIKRNTGFSVYNMGYDGMFSLQSSGLIYEFLSYTKNCKYIVIGGIHFLDRDWVIARTDLFYAYLNNENIYQSLYDIEPKKIAFARYLPGYKLTLLNKTFYKNLILKSDDASLGYEPINDTTPNFVKMNPVDYKIDEYVVSKLQTTINDIQKKGVKVIIVVPPIYSNGYHLLVQMDDIIEKYKSMAGGNVFFINYSKHPMCKEQRYFNNNTHLNVLGATKFSEIFSNDLMQIEKSTK